LANQWHATTPPRLKNGTKSESQLKENSQLKNATEKLVCITFVAFIIRHCNASLLQQLLWLYSCTPGSCCGSTVVHRAAAVALQLYTGQLLWLYSCTPISCWWVVECEHHCNADDVRLGSLGEARIDEVSYHLLALACQD